MNPQISVSSVSERDIDLLLLEEFVASASFGSWFIGQASQNDHQIEACISAQRSVTQSNGESDLELLFQISGGRRLLVMIENKVTAGFQPKQAERYQSRGANYMNRGDCDQTLTVITAPQSYFGRSDSCKGFDGRVTYETVLDWFRRASDLTARKYYKLAVLQAAIDKSGLGYQPVEDALATKFWRDYWELVRALAPELRMAEPGVKTAGSTFIGFKPAGLPIGADIVHKLTGTGGSATGFVDLQFPGMGEHVLELWNALREHLEHDMSLVRASGSAAVRIIVPTVDPNKEADPQCDQIRVGLAAAQRLLKWFLSAPHIATAIDKNAQ